MPWSEGNHCPSESCEEESGLRRCEPAKQQQQQPQQQEKEKEKEQQEQQQKEEDKARMRRGKATRKAEEIAACLKRANQRRILADES